MCLLISHIMYENHNGSKVLKCWIFTFCKISFCKKIEITLKFDFILLTQNKLDIERLNDVYDKLFYSMNKKERILLDKYCSPI